MLENGKERGGRRFPDRYFSECFGINSKKNEKAVRQLVTALPIAVEEEKHLNQDISCAENCSGCLTSTIGFELEKIMESPRSTKDAVYNGD